MTLGLLLPLVALEALLRLAGPILPGDYQTASFTSSAVGLARQNRPYSAGHKRTSEYSIRVRVNSKRLRGPEVEYAKAPDTFRALVLGDSFTFALQVEEEETFVSRLGQRLEQTTGAPVTFETINGGTDGWTTVNELVWLATEGHRYEPDLVVLMFFVGNDVGENADQVRAVGQGGRLLPQADVTHRWDDARRTLTDWSAAYNLLEHGVLVKLAPEPDRSVGRESGRPRAARSPDAERERMERGWAISEQLLEQLRDLCAVRGIGLIVVGIPTAEQANGTSQTETLTRFGEIGDRVGVPTVNLLKPFRAAPDAQRAELYFQKDRHWTADGHDLAARVVAAELRRADLVPGSPR